MNIYGSYIHCIDFDLIGKNNSPDSKNIGWKKKMIKLAQFFKYYLLK